MPDNTNVNNNSSVVVVGRTAPVPPGQQKSDKSIPVVIANDQSTIPVAEQNKVQSEVALSLLGIPRSEVALGIFADVNTYDVNPTEWSTSPEQYQTVASTQQYDGITKTQCWGLSHVPLESGALVESPADKSAVLTSKRFFRYQPGRVSAATFGVKTTTIADSGSRNSQDTTSGSSNNVNGSDVVNKAVLNPSIRKYGIFDNFDGYYWETRNNGKGDNFSVVRRTQSLIYENPIEFGITAGKQSQDYGIANPIDPMAARASESTGAGSTAVPTGYENKEFGDLIVLRDNLLMTHAGVYDPSMLQDEHKAEISSISAGSTDAVFSFNPGSSVGLAVSISNAVYDITTGLMIVTTHEKHGFKDGKFLTLAGIGMTCDIPGVSASATEIVKYYPINTRGYNIVKVNSSTEFVINVGVSTVPTFYHGGGWAVGLSTGQYVSYDGDTDRVGTGITGINHTQIFKVRKIGINTSTGITTCTLNTFNANNNSADTSTDGVTIPKGEQALQLSTIHSFSGIGSHYLVTPVPFVQPINAAAIPNADSATKYAYGANSVKTNDQVTDSTGTGMFPYMYTSADQKKEGYIDTSVAFASLPDLKNQISDLNAHYKKWVNMSVKKDYWNVYEYRVPRSRFSGDRLDGETDNLLYSDVVATNKAGEVVRDPDTGAITTDTSIWNLEFDKVTMYKIEFSWYGAVGALFLAYVPVSSGEARWVRVHHLRASNQLKVSSLGNATLPITYMIYGGGNPSRFGYTNDKRVAVNDDYGSSSQHIVKYGASYYIDGGDRGTVKLFSHATPGTIDVYGSTRKFNVAAGSTNITVSNSGIATSPHIDVGSSTGLTTSYYIGSKVITGNPLDQGIEVTYFDKSTNKLYLNAPLNSTTIPNNTIEIIPQRPTPLVGIKCRDYIQSSTGQDVRNRTQVYPTRLSTGSDGLVKVDMLKTPLFQTTAKVTNSTGPTLGAKVNIGRRGKPTKVSIPLTTYTSQHLNGAVVSETAGAVVRTIDTSGSATNKQAQSTNTAYDSATGILTLGMKTGHSVGAGDYIQIKLSSISFTCLLDNHATTHSYPRLIDPMMDNNDTNFIKAPSSVPAQDMDADGTWSKTIKVITTATNAITFRVTNQQANGNSSDVGSAAEYIRDIGTGVYGWFRGYYSTDIMQKEISVLGYLENKGSDRTKNIEDDGYYFSAVDSTNDDIILFGTSTSVPDSRAKPFIREEYSVAKDGGGTADSVAETTLAQLSSIKVSPEVRSPIPGTGTIVATVYAPPGGEQYDLSPYFDYNKEYLSFPLTNKVESLYLCASTTNAYNVGASVGTADVGIGTIKVSASLTWEEQ